jgi:FkbM family methyltransferase
MLTGGNATAVVGTVPAMVQTNGDLSRLDPDLRRRVEMTTSVRVTDRIEKVAQAGSIQMVDGHEVQVMHNGVVVEKDCYGGPWMTEVISRLRGHHEPQEEIAFAEIVDTLEADTTAPVMIELGSYWAYYSLWVKHQIPSSTVVLVEPDERNLQVGVRNFELNQLAPSEVVHAAVGAAHNSTVDIQYESDGVIRPVRAVTLDGLVADTGLERVDLLLCDVQGAEVEMLAGAAASVRDGKVRFMVISTHWSDTAPLIHQVCRARIERLGGHIICEHSLPESCSGDGLIVASFDPRDREMHIDVPIVRARDSEVGELEWVIAGRSGWRGIVWGAVDLVPASTRRRLGVSRLGHALHRRLAARRAVG